MFSTLWSVAILLFSIVCSRTSSLVIRSSKTANQLATSIRETVSNNDVKSENNKRGFTGYTQSLKKEGAYAAAANSSIILPAMIIVNPYLDENVGSCARTMLNFGLYEMRVVDPRCDILSEKARALAVGGYEILENAKIYSTVEECVADLQMVMATTIRPRHMTQMILSPQSAAEKCISLGNNDNLAAKSGIMFGRERSGLTNEEVALADAIVTISTFKKFSSLNLAQAVNIVGYEIWKAKLNADDTAAPDMWLHPKDGTRLATRQELEHLMKRLEHSLNAKDYQSNENMREHSFRNIRNVVQRTMVTKTEVDLLQGVLTTLNKPFTHTHTKWTPGDEESSEST